jgi:hypothetical protein
VYVEYESESGEEFIIANLSYQCPNVSVDLAFTNGEKFAFKVTAPGLFFLLPRVIFAFFAASGII